ncbi:MAG: hypothetical protein ISR95_07080 [Candidatus Marinimicrobia bacterium]|nr:hypothetical protein [Candidatus Brocadiales bacterium]MBL7047372.1 hypothetical protein [Candidatus Neomarinimicrobiota bacterium]
MKHNNDNISRGKLIAELEGGVNEIREIEIVERLCAEYSIIMIATDIAKTNARKKNVPYKSDFSELDVFVTYFEAFIKNSNGRYELVETGDCVYSIVLHNQITGNVLDDKEGLSQHTDEEPFIDTWQDKFARIGDVEYELTSAQFQILNHVVKHYGDGRLFNGRKVLEELEIDENSFYPAFKSNKDAYYALFKLVSKRKGVYRLAYKMKPGD